MVEIDLSQLNILVYVWNAFLQAVLPIVLIGVYIAFMLGLLAAAGVGGYLLVKRLSMNAVSAKNVHQLKREAKHIRGLRLFSLLALELLLFSVMAASPAGGAPAINGSVSIGTLQVAANTPVTALASSLDASTAYALYWGSTALINWTSGTTAEDRTFTFEATPPASGNSVILYLYSANTTVDSKVIAITTAGTFLPIGFLIGLGVAIMIIGFVVMMASAFAIKKVRGK